MKKLAGMMMMIAVVSFTAACGGASENDATDQETMDSIAAAEAAGMEEAEMAKEEAQEAISEEMPADSTAVEGDSTAVQNDGEAADEAGE